ncbi:unnamed protein product [Rotaria sordida]|uniref:Uncharacterized protein n=1 Tax=Rotaria sordida TaxID=392033 RepID=A0A813SIB4_9BILA|nr:unnamed protein product [Rotaria sordida]CAF1517845.1 unnamed protein product [Rotaria sordida]CAF1518050.1 unnamed protein product [Rotaria sordida]
MLMSINLKGRSNICHHYTQEEKKVTLNGTLSKSHHTELCITFITVNESDEESILSHVYICDLTDCEPLIDT